MISAARKPVQLITSFHRKRIRQGPLTVICERHTVRCCYSDDANGNRTNTGYTTGDNNQLTSDGTWDYEYDSEGNRTKKTHATTGDYVEYTLDHRNRLTAVTFRDSADVKTKEVTYVYDVYDRRIAKDCSPGRRRRSRSGLPRASPAGWGHGRH